MDFLNYRILILLLVKKEGSCVKGKANLSQPQGVPCAPRYIGRELTPSNLLIRLYHDLRDSFKDLLKTMDHLTRKKIHTNCVI